jgi:hypothetical protein
MKNAILIVLFAVAACGGSDSGAAASKDLTKFTGAPWNGSVTTTLMCPGQAPVTGSAALAISFSGVTNGADLEYTSRDGCLYRFVVTGTTASLSNGPVTCGLTSPSGAAVVGSITSYSATTSDGHNLAISSSGTLSSGGASCPIATTGAATR